MNYKKIIILPLNDKIEDNFLNEKCNIILNDGKEFIIELNPSVISPNSQNSNLGENNNSFTLIKNLDLKFIMSNSIKNKTIKPEMLLLYCKIDDKIILLNDCEIYSFNNPIYNSIINNSNNTSGFNSEMRSTGLQNLKKIFTNRSSIHNNHESKDSILYYKICDYNQKVMIDIFQNKIEKIILNIPICCSVYMLKFLILMKLKVKNLDIIKNYNLYGAGFLDRQKLQCLNRATTNKKFEDNNLIYDIMKYYFNPQNCSDKILNLILIEKTSEQCSMGLDFRFNILKNFKKLEHYDLNAPSFRNVSDGMNLFIYCLNKSCKLYNNYFTICKGYGSFDILNILEDIICPFCHLNKLSLRNLGMINSKWVYKGFLKSKFESKINGDGITLENNKLYIIKEIIFEDQFLNLLLEVEFYQTKTSINSNINKNSFQSSIQNIEGSFFQSSNDISESDLNNLNFEQKYLSKDNIKKNSLIEVHIPKEFTFEKQENEETNKQNENHNDNDILNLFQKKESNKTKNSKKNNDLEIDIKIDCKKEPCCLNCGRITQNYQCTVW